MTTTIINLKSVHPPLFIFEVLDAWYGPSGKKYIAVQSINHKILEGGTLLKYFSEYGTLELVSKENENPPAG
jgi:hypothetical protein